MKSIGKLKKRRDKMGKKKEGNEKERKKGRVKWK